jgi:hypothetical protein
MLKFGLNSEENRVFPFANRPVITNKIIHSIQSSKRNKQGNQLTIRVKKPSTKRKILIKYVGFIMDGPKWILHNENFEAKMQLQEIPINVCARARM